MVHEDVPGWVHNMAPLVGPLFVPGSDSSKNPKGLDDKAASDDVKSKKTYLWNPHPDFV